MIPLLLVLACLFLLSFFFECKNNTMDGYVPLVLLFGCK